MASYAEILATDPILTDQDHADFASFMTPDQAASYLFEVAQHRL